MPCISQVSSTSTLGLCRDEYLAGRLEACSPVFYGAWLGCIQQPALGKASQPCLCLSSVCSECVLLISRWYSDKT
eukprot:scaffold587682_cov18-Prasinocladus_malaysianus.AAC.1